MKTSISLLDSELQSIRNRIAGLKKTLASKERESLALTDEINKLLESEIHYDSAIRKLRMP